MNREAFINAGKVPVPRLRRAYFDCRYGQLHVHNAVPGGGGFDELTTVICLHDGNETGRVFSPVLEVLGADRSVFAPDLPGCGESDPAPGDADAGVNAIVDFLTSMRIRSVDLVARGTGCDVALRLAQEPESRVRRLALITDRPPSTQIARLAVALPFAAWQAPGLGARLSDALSG